MYTGLKPTALFLAILSQLQSHHSRSQALKPRVAFGGKAAGMVLLGEELVSLEVEVDGGMGVDEVRTYGTDIW